MKSKITSPVQSEIPDDKGYPTLQLDLGKYQDGVSELDISEEQATAYLQALWNIMHTMVDAGMELDSIQMFFPEKDENTVIDSGNDVKQLKSTHSFNNSASATNEEE